MRRTKTRGVGFKLLAETEQEKQEAQRNQAQSLKGDQRTLHNDFSHPTSSLLLSRSGMLHAGHVSLTWSLRRFSALLEPVQVIENNTRRT